MAQKIALEGYPFNKNTGRGAQQSQYTRFARYMMPTGVVSKNWPAASSLVNDECKVYGDSSGMQIKVKTGELAVRGFWAAVIEEKTLAIDSADPTNPRIDLIVARLENNDTSNSDIYLYVKTGTPAASPTAPSLIQTEEIYEQALAQVYVGPGVVTIESDDVSDARILITQIGFVTLSMSGRLTLSYGHPLGDIEVIAHTPSSTNTTTDSITFSAAPGWETGQAVQPDTTIGGLTASTTYYVRDDGTGLIFTLHPTRADALANTNLVNLTASITAAFYPSELRYEVVPGMGNYVTLPDSNGVLQFYKVPDDVILDLAGKPSGDYDIYLYYNSGVQIEATARSGGAATYEVIDGIKFKTGANEHLYIGMLRIDTTGQPTDYEGARNLYNEHNKVERRLHCDVNAASYTCNTGSTAWREANGLSVVGQSRIQIACGGMVNISVRNVEIFEYGGTSTNPEAFVGIGINSSLTSVSKTGGIQGFGKSNEASAVYHGWLSDGIHTVRMLECTYYSMLVIGGYATRGEFNTKSGMDGIAVM